MTGRNARNLLSGATLLWRAKHSIKTKPPRLTKSRCQVDHCRAFSQANLRLKRFHPARDLAHRIEVEYLDFHTRTVVMAIPLSNEIRVLLDAPNFTHLATLMPDGSPHSVPVWVGREADRILICTGEGSLKAKNTRRDPRVALSLVNFHNPYEEAQLRGHVVERRPDGDFCHMDLISHKFTGKRFPFRGPEGRVLLVIEIDKARYTKLPFEHTPGK